MPQGRIQGLHCSSGEQVGINLVQLSQLTLLLPHRHVISLPRTPATDGAAVVVVEPEGHVTGQAHGCHPMLGFYPTKPVTKPNLFL